MKKCILDGAAVSHLYHRSCYSNSLFHAINTYQKDWYSVIINDISVYSRYRSRVEVDYKSYQPLDDLLRGMGLYLESKKTCRDILEDCIAALDRHSPVIVWIDLFYASIRPDFYQKEHLAHSWMIYGYDRTEEVFHIIEHKNKDSMAFHRMTVSFSDLYRCYQGFVDLHMGTCGVTRQEHCHLDCGYPYNPYYREKCRYSKLMYGRSFDMMYSFESLEQLPGFERKGLPEKHELLDRYTTHLLNCKEDIFNGMAHLGDYFAKLRLRVTDRQSYLENSRHFVELMNAIVAGKQVEQFKVQKLLPEQDRLINQLDGLVNHYISARSMFLKLSLIEKSTPAQFSKGFDLLSDSIAMEKNCYETLFRLVSIYIGE